MNKTLTLSLEHSKAVYYADLATYGAVVASLAMAMVWYTPLADAWAATGCLVAGLTVWSALEYLVHRFVLHGVAPFKHWHEMHHERPHALICTPTWISLSAYVLFILLPLAWLLPLHLALATAFGIFGGSFAYSLTHHAVHHVRPRSAWLRDRKHWHARHHQKGARAVCFGVTTGVWDFMLGSR